MEWLSLDLPFAHTGLDFMGPLYLCDGKSSKEEGSDKVYICLFTCAFTRVIHLELTPLSVSSFLLAFWRFISHRGLPVTLLSDNVKTFRSATRDIRKMMQSDEGMRYLSDDCITWNFIIERAPWWGGRGGWVWERMVKVVKQPLKKTVGCTSLNYDKLTNHNGGDRGNHKCMTINICLWWWRVHFHSTYTISSYYWQMNY